MLKFRVIKSTEGISNFSYDKKFATSWEFFKELRKDILNIDQPKSVICFIVEENKDRDEKQN